MIISEGDWILTGAKGERYPCKPDIIEMTYEIGEDIKEYEMSAYSMFGKDEIERKKEEILKINK